MRGMGFGIPSWVSRLILKLIWLVGAFKITLGAAGRQAGSRLRLGYWGPSAERLGSRLSCTSMDSCWLSSESERNSRTRSSSLLFHFCLGLLAVSRRLSLPLSFSPPNKLRRGIAFTVWSTRRTVPSKLFAIGNTCTMLKTIFGIILIPLTFGVSGHENWNQCYYHENAVAPPELLPCQNETDVGPNDYTWCCFAGHECLDHNSCWDPKTTNTYQYGCNDETYSHSSCPHKGDLDRGKLGAVTLHWA
ncbi:hypothetical protein CGCS363_v006311 [Colletotrichum siamense]|uniref:uncharacterized protein n=1 Tax=Colletotrichum siamense TaxID=690259 RepID=UPI00187292F7|nr:uncharacterized protein CGCS363_v006311 [Colletotrichum siamense]KAF5501694.1 hypothetical protein CGCS363_v006311 [Colletotrichum siamense]